MESWEWAEAREGAGRRGKFISTLSPKMLILGLDNRKEAAKITMKSFPKRHLVTSDLKMHLQKSTLLAHPGLPDESWKEPSRLQTQQGETEAWRGFPKRQSRSWKKGPDPSLRV